MPPELMPPELMSQLYLVVLRLAHILAAIVAVGGLFYTRFGLLPAMETLDDSARERLHDAIRPRWLPWVIGSITLLLVSGLANFLIFNDAAKDWDGGTWMRQTRYHALFGVKFLLALAVFYLASGLVGRSEGTAWIRANRRRWLSVTLALAVVVVGVSGWMRGLHIGPNRLGDADSGEGVQLDIGPPTGPGSEPSFEEDVPEADATSE